MHENFSINNPPRTHTFTTHTSKYSEKTKHSYTSSFNSFSFRPSSSIMDVIMSMVADKPVVIFSRSTCDMSHSIRLLISGFGANPTVYELDQVPNGQQVEQALLQMGCGPVPVVYIGQRLIGGPNQIMSLQIKNQLGTMLKRAGAIWI